jgi:hypothetical protein
MSFYGFHRAGGARMAGTCRAVRARLRVGPGLYLRYEQSREAGEGAFGICGFWMADHLARGGGTLAEAVATFEEALRWKNDVGLFAEEVEVASGEPLGNFPQAYTHVGLVNAALTLEARARRAPRAAAGRGGAPGRRGGGAVNWFACGVWGFGATVLLTTVLAGSQALGLTRMNLPYLLGTMVTPDRDRAKTLGFAIHLVNGWIFSLIYAATLHAWGGPAWWKGVAIGVVHAMFVLAVGLPALPGLHPRMASEAQGPTVVRQLEPPGFLALHYGARTPVSVVFAHVVYGLVMGVMYHP